MSLWNLKNVFYAKKRSTSLDFKVNFVASEVVFRSKRSDIRRLVLVPSAAIRQYTGTAQMQRRNFIYFNVTTHITPFSIDHRSSVLLAPFLVDWRLIAWTSHRFRFNVPNETILHETERQVSKKWTNKKFNLRLSCQQWRFRGRTRFHVLACV